MSYKYKLEYAQGAMVKLPARTRLNPFFSKWLSVRQGFGDAQHVQVAVPAHYAWDGCTVVKDWAWNKRGSLFHDALYQYAGQHPLTRQQCDYIFFKVCLEDSHEAWEALAASVYYIGLRLCGWYYWNRRKKTSGT